MYVLLRYASAITEQKKCWELLAENFDRFQTLRNNTQQHLRNNMQQGVQTDAACNIQQCCTGLKAAAIFLVELSFAGLPPLFLCRSLAIYSKFVDMTINLSLKL